MRRTGHCRPPRPTAARVTAASSVVGEVGDLANARAARWDDRHDDAGPCGLPSDVALVVAWPAVDHRRETPVSFLRRFLGRATPAPASEPPSRAWFDLPPGGSFEIAGVGHHREELAQLFPPTAGEPDRVSAVAVLVREPDNPHDSYAVAVLIEGRRVGYIPADTAPDWADFLGRLDDEGYRCRATRSRPASGTRTGSFARASASSTSAAARTSSAGSVDRLRSARAMRRPIIPLTTTSSAAMSSTR